MEEYYSFEDMNLKENLLRGVLSYGFEKPSSVQSKGIMPVINKCDSIIQAQSGTGKTATFSISALQIIDENIKSCQVIIISPTREIADQTLSVVLNLGHYLNINIYGAIGGKIYTGTDLIKSELIIGTPGRILDMIIKGYINMKTLKLFILDEADQMLNKGFKNQIIEIFQYISDNIQVAIYSATMPEEILDLTKKFMKNPKKILVKKENLTLEGIKQYYVVLNSEQEKYFAIIELYQILTIGQSIIYCNSKKKVSWLSEKFNEQGYPISCIHGDIIQKERDNIMKNFRTAETRVLITTDLLSRGIDVQQVSLVINYDLPRDFESYIHRIGRTGRYGRKGFAINFIMSENDIKTLDNLQSFYNTEISELPANIEEIIHI